MQWVLLKVLQGKIQDTLRAMIIVTILERFHNVFLQEALGV